MQQIAVIGCGVIGATIAYELSQLPDVKVIVLDRQAPAQASTGAALGVLMGIISQKTRGRAWAMRQASIRRYETLIPELEAATGHPIPWNQQGILMLNFEESLARWEALAQVRQAQGWQLQIWDLPQIQSRCPQINPARVTGAIYSPHDRQVDPTALTLALVAAAEQNGATFWFDVEVSGLNSRFRSLEQQTCHQIQLGKESIAVDLVIIAAGLGSTGLTQMAKRPVDVRPVLGQALRLHLDHPLGDATFQPVMTGEDIHIVPLGDGEYWVGATVEFPNQAGEVVADPEQLQAVWQGALALCPALKQATILKTWSGLRPRPSDRPAPVIEQLSGYDNVIVATGHYRNGILLAPATALAVRDAVLGLITSGAITSWSSDRG